MKKFLSLIALFVAFSSSLWANNLSISVPACLEQNATNQTVNIMFDIRWNNSWRTSAAPNNWDAAWLFVKYKKVSDGNWYHVTLNANDASHSTGSQGAGATIDARGDGKGAFFYRSTDGTGTFASNQVKLCWNYGSDGISNNLASEIASIQVFGIEMCYIPQGAFYVGSGSSEGSQFYTYGTNNPYQISSENVINTGQTNGFLWATGGIEASTIPESFPKGYNAFYCMKYEITQEQYTDFLNTLTRTQQNTRTYINLASGVTSISNRYVMVDLYWGQNRNGIRCDESIHASNPITFYCDFNGNGVPNEANDGQSIACNWLSWADGTAYSDWSGLRPMTELEYEKICRGSATPVANEYAWGSTYIISAGTSASNITNSGAANESSNVIAANCNHDGIQGPIRVGCFSGGTRQSSGASYYGVMEMSGNLYERTVTVAINDGRAYTGNDGDGLLSNSGNSNIVNCPNEMASGTGIRGGYFANTNSYGYVQYLRVSNRSDANYPASHRDKRFGFRCVSGL